MGSQEQEGVGSRWAQEAAGSKSRRWWQAQKVAGGERAGGRQEAGRQAVGAGGSRQVGDLYTRI